MRVLIALLMVVGMVVVVPQSSEAQNDNLHSITWTESFINTAIQADQTSTTDVFSVDLQPGQVVLRLDGVGQQPYSITLTLAPSVQNGQAEWPATSLTLNDFEIDLQQFEQSGGDQVADTFKGFVEDQNPAAGTLQSITVTDTAISLFIVPGNPNDPTIDVVDNDLSLTFTEAAINSYPSITNPNDPRFSNVSVDFQNNAVVLNGTYTPIGGTPQGAQVTFVPLVNNGTATWTVSAMVIDGQSKTATEITQMNDSLVLAWRAFFTQTYQTGNLTSIIITDNAATVTWDGDLAEPSKTTGLVQSDVVLTEADINNFFRVADPQDYRASDVVVDLQPGQVVIGVNWNLNNGNVVSETVTMVPILENGAVRWVVTEATLGGEPFEAAAIEQMNNSISTWWGGFYWGSSTNYQITTIQVTDTEMRYTAVPR